jgi:ketosteroid isomerase-like protein
MNEAEKLARDLLEAFLRRDAAAASALIAPDAVWRFADLGNERAGAHVGRDAIPGFPTKVVGLAGGSSQMEPRDFVANDRVAYFRLRGKAERDGGRLDNDI